MSLMELYPRLHRPPPAAEIPRGAVWIRPSEAVPPIAVDGSYHLCDDLGCWLRFNEASDAAAHGAHHDRRRAARNRALADEVLAARRARSDSWKALQARSARIRRAHDAIMRHHRADEWERLQRRGKRNAQRRLVAA